ncbi:MAG: hypothetical protein M1814_003960 [Vezdaea aestivalis]|nr:MAG: hypothetical protein M1814_003960 [Vezdaea aestivalis]
MGDYSVLNGTYQPGDPRNNQNDTYTQLVISIALGVGAFASFCFARPRWAGLYAGRKRRDDAASALPDLPDTYFGWIPVLYRVTQEEVLASAGLDAYALLSFCRLALKFISIAFLFGLVVLYPVHHSFLPDSTLASVTNNLRRHVGQDGGPNAWSNYSQSNHTNSNHTGQPGFTDDEGPAYLWMYVVFVYLFSGLLIYLVFQHTREIIRIRQNYLGSQSTITDRTIKLSGIPFELRSEDKIKKFVEGLEIGRVKNVTLCRNWEELDSLMERRRYYLRKLEEVWTVYLHAQQIPRDMNTLPIVQPNPPVHPRHGDDEGTGLLPSSESNGPEDRPRPEVRLRYGFLKLRSRKVDAIDYFEEKLRKLDEQITATRKKKFTPVSLAFVTMDSVATCQMAVQAILDASPLILQAKPAPAPPEIVWKNTYMTRRNRMTRSWIITIFVIFLTVLWVLLLGPVAGLMKLSLIKEISPPLGRAISQRPVLKAFVQTSLPTLAWSLLNIAVPYLYDWLSNYQGIIAQGDVELSVIAKNFAFSFFNLFIFYTVIGVAFNMWSVFRDSFKDTTTIAFQLAKNLDGMASFYMNLIILQGIGLFPFRLLDFGSVALYPISLIGSKTPRDYDELVQPSVFGYGFYLPQTIVIFIVCVVYSILPVGVVLLFFGLIYFTVGYFTYKYQLLYAMVHSRHATGRIWSIIVNGVLLGLLVFQLAMIGELAVKKALKRSVLLVPLLPITAWCAYFYRRNYSPLTRFIALNSIDRTSHERGEDHVDEEREAKDMKYVNPNLVTPLEKIWVPSKPDDSN